MTGKIDIHRFLHVGGEAVLSEAVHTEAGSTVSRAVVVRQITVPNMFDWSSEEAKEVLKVSSSTIGVLRSPLT